MEMYLDFTRACNIIIDLIHIWKFRKCGLEKLSIRGLESLLGCYTERVVRKWFYSSVGSWEHSTPEFSIVKYFY